MEKQTKETRGRKPTGEKALTNTEKSRRQRVKKTFSIKAAEESGYIPTMIMLNKQQLEALNEMEQGFGNQLTQDKLDAWVFIALREFLKDDMHKNLESVKRGLPENCHELSMIQTTAKLKFQQWEKNQK